ncbi:MAG: hypothetical protein JW841_02780 [Deltaproteobacteria bacterium]|nr:hypothetical protein [Deltaproteobacteria bacterium]
MITSLVRQKLLRMLWLENNTGSVRNLAQKANLSFAAVHKELEAMHTVGLALVERVGNSLIYRSNTAHPSAKLLLSLLSINETPNTSKNDDTVRKWLKAIGAPLAVSAATKLPVISEIISEALILAHHDAVVARVLPFVLYCNRKEDFAAIIKSTAQRNELQALGMFLQMAGELRGDKSFANIALQLRDRRYKRLRPFFYLQEGRYATTIAKRNTPKLVSQWGYFMNMGLDSFAAIFDKHTVS